MALLECFLLLSSAGLRTVMGKFTPLPSYRTLESIRMDAEKATLFFLVEILFCFSCNQPFVLVLFLGKGASSELLNIIIIVGIKRYQLK